MSNIFSRSVFINFYQIIAVVSLISLFNLSFFNPALVSNANAQSAEQKALAERFGINIDDIRENFGQQNNNQNRQNEDLLIEPPEKKEKEDLRKYLGFREDLKRFGEELFNSERKDFRIADDAQVPDDYLLGLGDQIIIQYYGAVTGDYIIEIDRDGKILLPKIGPVILNGLKLKEARELITTRVNTNLVGVNATVTVGKTKFINVFVAGNVIAPGVFAMPSLSRVTHAIYLAGGISELGTYRDIQVKRQGKLIGSLDLYDFLIYGDNSSDINLKPNDVILVGTSEKNLQVTGAVKRPGVFELKRDDDIADIIKIFGGYAPGADKENIIYSSLSSNKPNQVLNFTDIGKFQFFDGDAIFIKFKPTVFNSVNKANVDKLKSSAIKVYIEGEVNYPGSYLLKSGDRISDLVGRAGGVTEFAFLDGTVFTRETVRQREAFRARELAEQVRRQVVSSSQTQSTNRLDTEEVKFITEQLDNYTGIGRVIVDMPRALSGRQDSDLVLTDGDKIYVPTKSNTVTVFGEVRRQSSFVYNKRYAIEDYLTKAAGLTQLADEENIYIVKANGNIEIPRGGWFTFGSSKIISEGDTIIVPVNYDYRQSLPFWRDVISIVYQGAVAVAAINGL